MLVRLEKDWDYPDLRRQTPNLDGRWGDIRITEEPVAECDLLIVLNSPRRDIRVRVPEGNKWLFTQESPIEQYRWHQDSFRYFDRIFTFWDKSVAARIEHAQTALPWHIGRNYPQLKALTRDEAVATKRDGVSWVTSNATHKEGHRLRMKFKDYLVDEGFAFHLYGRGFDPIDDKFDALFPYKYSIAIENYACDDYWTEKLADCFLSWTVPIYAGATNVLQYFPANAMIAIDPSDPAGALRTIRTAIDDDHFGRHLDAIHEARELVLERYQFFPNVARQFERFGAPTSTPKQRVSIPANATHYVKSSPTGHVKRIVKSTLAELAWRLR